MLQNDKSASDTKEGQVRHFGEGGVFHFLCIKEASDDVWGRATGLFTEKRKENVLKKRGENSCPTFQKKEKEPDLWRGAPSTVQGG